MVIHQTIRAHMLDHLVHTSCGKSERRETAHVTTILNYTLVLRQLGETAQASIAKYVTIKVH